MSLQDIAKSPGRAKVGKVFDAFATYFSGPNSDPNYADTLFKQILRQEGDFSTALPEHITALSTGLLTNIVMFLAILEKLYSALEYCQNEDTSSSDAGALEFDKAVAYYVGSIEGSIKGGRGGGELLYAVAKDFCDPFNVCDSNGNASSNVEIMELFSLAAGDLIEEDCSSLEEKIEKEISPLLLVPLIQGTLNAAKVTSSLADDEDDASIGDAFIFSRSLLPLFTDDGHSANSDIIENKLSFNALLVSKSINVDKIFDALQALIENMTIIPLAQKCNRIGRYQLTNISIGDFCQGKGSTMTGAPFQGTPKPKPHSIPVVSPSVAPIVDATSRPPYTQAPLGFGRYSFKNNVDGIAALSKDVQEMKQATSIDIATSIYQNGKNSVVGVDDRVVSLAALSRTAATDMREDPMFNIFRWALLEKDELSKAVAKGFDPIDSAYADKVVAKALENAQDKVLAAEGAVIMSVWMEIAHELYNAVDYCRKGDERATLSLDRGMALWLGVDQVEGSSDTGNFMYSLSQKAESNFGNASDESKVNDELIDNFRDASEMAGNCNGNTQSVALLTKITSQILRIMTIPLLQHLIFYIWKENKEYTQLYAMAVIPQAAGCSESSFGILKDKLLVDEEDFSFDNSDVSFLDAIKKFQRCLRISCDDIIGNSTPGVEILNHIFSFCDEQNGGIKNLAGYVPENQVYEISRLDLDALQIGILMESNAFIAAKRLYQTGYNSLEEGNSALYSLQSLATSDNRDGVPQYDTFKNYFLKDNYSDDFTLSTLDGSGVFAKADKDERAEAATRAIQGMISYMAVVERLHVAVSLCQKGQVKESVKSWDEGVALFVGSIEGSSRGGAPIGDGTLMYSLAKETANLFGTVEGSGDASSNEKLILSMQDGQSFLSNKNCAGAQSSIANEILELLPVPIVQGILYYAVENANLNAGDSNPALASSYVLSESMQPLIYSVNATSANIISSQLLFDPDVRPAQNAADTVFEAIAYSLPGLKINCNDVGLYKSRSVCNSSQNANGDEGGKEDNDNGGNYEAISPHTETSTSLSNGLYTTTTYVQDRANIAIDLKDIINALNSGSYDLARILYQKGENSVVYNDKGIEIGQRSIASFSLEDTKDMLNEPLINIYQYALRDNQGKFLGNDSRVYADSIVNHYLDNIISSDKDIAADAMLVLNIWMKLIHELFQTVENCRNKKIADMDGVHSIDEAVAYWIGDGQVTGDGDKGHLFYALAERMGDKFQININGQSKTNQNILRLFNQARLELTFPNACSENPNTYTRLRQIVTKIISQMVIPLMQKLIDSLYEDQKHRVQLYSFAVVPLIAPCDPELYDYLHSKLIQNTYNIIENEDIIARLQTAYNCLGLACDDIGQHTSGSGINCNDRDQETSLAGFTPTTDVGNYAKLDLDILEIKILMEMQAYQAVDDLYTYGKHAEVDGFNGEEMLTLSSLATTSDRSIVPQLKSFFRYYGNRKYADSLIRDALDPLKFTNASPEQRKEIVVNAIQYLVVYMGALQAAYAALNLCQDGSSNLAAEQAWDKSAALLVGSIEGSSYGGKANGQSFFALAKMRCREFDDCDDEGLSEVNKKLYSLFYTGKGEIQGSGCNAFSRTVKKIESTLLIPLIQSNLVYSLINDKEKDPSSSKFAMGYIFSRAVLPLVEDVSREQAQIIDKNMDFQFAVKPVVDGASAVFNAFAKVYSGLNVNCKDIGNPIWDGVSIDPCAGAGSIKVKKSSAITTFLILLPILAIAGIVSLFFVRRHLRRRRLKREEEAPIFHPSQAVLESDPEVLHPGHGDVAVVKENETLTKRNQIKANEAELT